VNTLTVAPPLFGPHGEPPPFGPHAEPTPFEPDGEPAPFGPHAEPRLFGPLDGEPTLDDELVGAWEGLAVRRTVSCPVCHGEMEPEYGAGGPPIGGRCATCGSSLR
jgi:hypothetical protein